MLEGISISVQSRTRLNHTQLRFIGDSYTDTTQPSLILNTTLEFKLNVHKVSVCNCTDRVWTPYERLALWNKSVCKLKPCMCNPTEHTECRRVPVVQIYLHNKYSKCLGC